VPAFQNRELLPQGQIFYEEITTGAKGTRKQPEPEAEHEHFS
jgi:hypothetical protein